MSTTRALSVPRLPLFDDFPDMVVVDDPDDPDVEPAKGTERTMVGIPIAVGRDRTRNLEDVLRAPGEEKFHVLAGFHAGADTEVIARGLANGEEWVTGSASLARDWLVIVNLSDPDVPPERRMAGWRPVHRPERGRG